MNEIIHSPESTARCNNIDIAYDAFGDPAAEPVLLIQGLSMQMIAWEDAFCEQIAALGCRVIRFDNRDVGRSTWFRAAGMPDIAAIMQAALQRKPVEVPYLLSDMAADTVGLLDALGLESAHVIGVSMGGMIGQTMAIHYPGRVRTLTSIMSSTGDPSLPPPSAEAFAVLVTPQPREREAYIENAVKVWRALSGPGAVIDEDQVKRRAGRFHERGLNPKGIARQMAAVLASGSRREALRSVKIPTLVIHGDIDPLVPLACGEDTAAHIPGATFRIIRGMGHNLDIVPSVWPELIGAIGEHVGKLKAER